ncbi:MAG: hypothetical protein ACI9QC_000536 [Oceanicoccus sp.]|jgi:hypothetical protein
MKKVFTLLLLTIFVFGCNADVPSTDYAPEIDELLSSTADFTPEMLFISASSELVDDTEYGFSYVANNVMDQDYSTAWCVEPYDLIREWSVTFPETVLAGKVGIQTGFARDEAIFSENNRVKSMDLYYDGEQVATLEFEDSYLMQFPELPEYPVTQMNFVITDVYEGSKYNDTCVSEIDFQSDYVQEEDTYAAYNYYIENKAADAIRPIGVRSISMTKTEGLLACGSLNSEMYFEENFSANETVFRDANGGFAYSYDALGDGIWDWAFNAGDHVAVSARMTNDLSLEDTVTLRWWEGVYDLEEGVRTWDVYHEADAYPQECENGSLYVSAAQTDAASRGPFVQYRIEVIYDGDVIGSTGFGFVQ